MRFATPEAFLLLLLVPLYLIFYLKINKKKGIPFPALTFFKGINPGFKTRLLGLLLPIRILTLILLIFTLARLQSGYERTETEIKGVDIMLAIDTSKSMLAQDLAPQNRIQAAKDVIAGFIEMQQGNRVGMVVFSGRSFTMSPLTLDYGILTDVLKDVNTETVRIDGTAIGDAIANALYRFDYSIARNKVIILLTDGENNSGKVSPQKASEMAALKGVKIYTIGVGRPEGTPIPLENPYTGEIEYALDISGNILMSKVNEEELVEIARETGGAYFRAGDTKTLEAVYRKIDQLEKSVLITRKFTSYSEKMYYFLIPAILLMLLDFILNKKILNPLKI